MHRHIQVPPENISYLWGVIILGMIGVLNLNPIPAR